MKRLYFLILTFLSLNSFAQTTAWSTTPTTTQTRKLSGANQIRWLWGSNLYSLEDTLSTRYVTFPYFNTTTGSSTQEQINGKADSVRLYRDVLKYSTRNNKNSIRFDGYVPSDTSYLYNRSEGLVVTALNGNLVNIFCRRTGKGEINNTAAIVKRTSRDGGRTWGNIDTIYNSVYGERNVQGGITATGRIYLIFRIQDAVADTLVSISRMYSNDTTYNSWSAPTVQPRIKTGHAVPYGQGVRDGLGRYQTFIHGDQWMESFSSIDGITWSSMGLKWDYTGSTPPAVYTNETSVAYIGGGKMIALVRNEQPFNKAYNQFISSDNGNTYTFQGITNLGGGSAFLPSPVIYADTARNIVFAFAPQRFANNSGNFVNTLNEQSKLMVYVNTPNEVFASPTAYNLQKIYNRPVPENFVFTGYPNLTKRSDGDYVVLFSDNQIWPGFSSVSTQAVHYLYQFTMKFISDDFTQNIKSDYGIDNYVYNPYNRAYEPSPSTDESNTPFLNSLTTYKRIYNFRALSGNISSLGNGDNSSTGNAQVRIQGYDNTSAPGAYIELSKSRGGYIDTLSQTVNGDILGDIVATGVRTSTARGSGARIRFQQNASIGANVPASIRISASGPSNLLKENLTISASGVGLGNTSPEVPLDVLGTAVPNTREVLSKFSVSDATSSFASIYNGTTSNNTNITSIGAINASTSSSLSINTFTTSANDSGTSPLLQLDNYRSTNSTLPWDGTLSSVVTRPLFRIRNGGVALAELSAAGVLNLSQLSISLPVKTDASKNLVSAQIVTADIANNAVTYSKIQAAGATSRLVGSPSSGTTLQDITLGTNLSMSANVLNAAGGGTVTGVSGTTNRITVATGTTTPVIDISATFEGLLAKKLGGNALDGVQTITGDSQTADGMGLVNVTRSSSGGNKAYYGLTRNGATAMAFGINTTNSFIMGTGPLRNSSATIDTITFEHNTHNGLTRIKNYLGATLWQVDASGYMKSVLPAYASGTFLPAIYNSTNDRFETSTDIPLKASANIFTALQTISATVTGALTRTPYLHLSNPTAATSGVPIQGSPAFRLSGSAWNSTAAAARSIDYYIYNTNSNGANTQSSLRFDAVVNGVGGTLLTLDKNETGGGTGTTTGVSVLADVLFINGLTTLTSYTVATLPATATSGSIAYVTDALAPTYGAVIVGGGAIKTLALYDGTNWTAH